MTSHAIERAHERLGVEMTGADLKRLAKRIDAGEGVKMRQNADGSQVWLIMLMGRAVRVVYRPIGQKIITFLPGGCHFTPPRSGKQKRRRAGKGRNR